MLEPLLKIAMRVRIMRCTGIEAQTASNRHYVGCDAVAVTIDHGVTTADRGLDVQKRLSDAESDKSRLQADLKERDERCAALKERTRSKTAVLEQVW